MATKKQETLPEEEILQEAVLQTDVNPELAEMPQPENDSPDAEPSQTDPEDSLEGAPSEEFTDPRPEEEPDSQTDMETNDGKPPSEPEEKISSQTDTDSAGGDDSSGNALGEESPKEEPPQTEPEKVKKPRGRSLTQKRIQGKRMHPTTSKRRLSLKESVRLPDRFRRCWPLMTSSVSRQMQKKPRTICWIYWSPRKPAAF